MEVLTESQFLERTLNTGGTREVIYNFNGFDRIENLQHSSYQSIIKEVELSSGLSLVITNASCRRPINCAVKHDNFNFLASKFYLSGHHGVICPQVEGVATNYTETKGKNYLFYLPNIREVEQYFPHEEVCLITIYTKINFLTSFKSNLAAVPSQLRSLIEQGEAPYFHLPVGDNLPAMQTVLWQIMRTPYKGMLQQIYLESKALELLVLQFSQLLETEISQQKSITLKQSEIDKIYQAREILINNIAEPPTLLDLAQQVEIHHMKLKQGFKELFATTPFAYLREYRLEKARNLLLENKTNVLSVASAVGYANSSHFAAAFKQKFGISPKSVRTGIAQ
ncbi:MAG: AraC family transcriptional regulator [Cyanobacteria bacterium P01_A01_bin.40]